MMLAPWDSSHPTPLPSTDSLLLYTARMKTKLPAKSDNTVKSASLSSPAPSPQNNRDIKQSQQRQHSHWLKRALKNAHTYERSHPRTREGKLTTSEGKGARTATKEATSDAIEGDGEMKRRRSRKRQKGFAFAFTTSLKQAGVFFWGSK